MKHFYDTIPQSPVEAQESESRAISQEEQIYNAIKYLGFSWTAWALKEEVFPNMEITSIRRALFNLEKQGKIVQNGFTMGPKGKPVGKYLAFTGKLF